MELYKQIEKIRMNVEDALDNRSSSTTANIIAALKSFEHALHMKKDGLALEVHCKQVANAFRNAEHENPPVMGYETIKHYVDYFEHMRGTVKGLHLERQH